MDDTEGFLDWFAGFVAGEGCFIISSINQGNRFYCRLDINLRDDDLPILLKIQETLGIGTICRRKGEGLRRSQVEWVTHSIDEALRLVEIFDAHPVRAKKQADYEIWKEAVLEISRGRRKGRRATYDRQRLFYLKQKLSLVRAYDVPEIEFEPEGEQLELAL